MMIQRSDHATSQPAEHHREPQQGAEVQSIAFHNKYKPDTESRKWLPRFRGGDWWLNVDYVESEVVDEREFLQILRSARRR